MGKEHHIRKVRLSDLKQIYQLEQICFGEDSFSLRQFHYLATKAKADFLVIEDADEISALIIILYRKNSSGLRLYSLAVSPNHRGKGLAKLLLDEAGRRAVASGYKFMTLEVNENNQDAIKLYLKIGFEVFGERSSYYKNGSKALLMRKEV